MEFSLARECMVAEQLRSRGITDARVLQAMTNVARHEFVPQSLQSQAYEDTPLAIGHGQTISQPYMVALMTESLRLSGVERVLEVGTGSGYQAAVISYLAKQIFSIERHAEIFVQARSLLDRLGYRTIALYCGDGSLGLSAEAPFDRILVTAASPKVPEPLIEQLVEGGIMIIPVGDRMCQELLRLEKRAGKVVSEPICSCVFVPLIGAYAWQDRRQETI